MNKIIIFIFILLNLLSFISSLDCQYRENITDYTETKFLPFDDEGNLLKEIEIILPSEANIPLKLINPNEATISVKITSNVQRFYERIPQKTWCNQEQNLDMYLNLSGHSTKEIIAPQFGSKVYCTSYKFLDLSSLDYLENEEVTIKPIEIIHQKEICKICYNGKLCLDDGISCEINISCGSGVCNPANKCGNFTGICPEGKILNSEKNICINSFFTEFKKNLIWIGLIFLILTGIVYFYRKNKHLERLMNKKLENLQESLKQKKSFKEKVEEIDDFERMVRGQCIISTNGPDRVQSYGEKLIYNFLLKKNIPFDYDKQITLSGSWCRPDFYLTEDDLIIEYWGLRGDSEYDLSMEKKKRKYKELGKRVIYFYKEDILHSLEFERLFEEKLKRLGVL